MTHATRLTSAAAAAAVAAAGSSTTEVTVGIRSGMATVS